MLAGLPPARRAGARQGEGWARAASLVSFASLVRKLPSSSADTAVLLDRRNIRPEREQGAAELPCRASLPGCLHSAGARRARRTDLLKHLPVLAELSQLPNRELRQGALAPHAVRLQPRPRAISPAAGGVSSAQGATRHATPHAQFRIAAARGGARRRRAAPAPAVTQSGRANTTQHNNKKAGAGRGRSWWHTC